MLSVELISSASSPVRHYRMALRMRPDHPDALRLLSVPSCAVKRTLRASSVRDAAREQAERAAKYNTVPRKKYFLRQ